ncbi:MAG: hypothetical protein U0930_23985, partial [Pirellulales bacterium]
MKNFTSKGAAELLLMEDWGFVRVTAASHPTQVANPAANADSAIEALQAYHSSSVVVFGELSLSGYTCGD